LWTTNGASGFAGESLYAIFWQVQELFALNQAYRVEERVPHLCLFGSTGGGEALAFDKTVPSPSVLLIPFVPMDVR